MKPSRWRWHLNIFHLHREIQIFKRHPPLPPALYQPSTHTHGSVSTYRGKGAVLLIEPNFDRSALLYHSPFSRLQTSGKWYVGEISTWRAYSVLSAAPRRTSCYLIFPYTVSATLDHPGPPLADWLDGRLAHTCQTIVYEATREFAKHLRQGID